jgi:orotate phosphoribosyltransferase
MGQPRTELLELLKRKSVFFGDFTLSSGAKSKYYIDCRLTTLDPQGAWLVGRVLHELIRREEAARKMPIRAVGGLTMGADPIALAIGMVSCWAKDPNPLQVFVVRKAPKAHGQTRLIEGNFTEGDTVVVVDDVITRGDSTLAAVRAVTDAGGQVTFVAVLVDREEGGRQKIEELGLPVFAVFRRSELVS